ncbi:hypothetical protein H4R18_004350 [Coemansia javaensis]|uniref:Uncharacterized protein n=1 Tax=Coemansia javaensis TaxID=2761396 RepID=A0A9W8HBW9_9FUNG|nr:hypothetical protein H4R18_004350 [Coemansia javaensis]
MNMRELPSDILHLVLQRSFIEQFGAGPTLKANLHLLAVCRRWRHIALSVVYGSVFVQYGERHILGGQQQPAEEEEEEEEPADVRCVTNLQLVAAAGCVQRVRRVVFDVNFLTSPFPGLAGVMRLMSGAAPVWLGARELEISMHAGFYPLGNEDAPSAGDCEADVRTAVDVLAAMMPQVRKLYFGGMSHSPVARELYGRLAGSYAGQLLVLGSRHSISVPRDVEFQQLTDARIEYDQKDGHRLPRIDPRQLRKLVLAGWPPNHSWATFAGGDGNSNGGSRAIRFPQLRTLDAVYYGEHSEDDVGHNNSDGQPWELHFPALQRLELKCARNTCALLEHAVLPSHLDTISIEVTAAALRAAPRLRLPSARYLVLNIQPGPTTGPGGFSAINRVLEDSYGSEEMVLAIHDYMVPVSPELITCMSLTRLWVSAPTGVDAMLDMVQRLPRLRSLKICHLVLDDVQSDISNPELDKGWPVAPFATSITRMSINRSRAEVSDEMLTSVVKYLLLRIPTMEKFAAIGATPAQIAEFVNVHGDQYPHLKKVRFEFFNR